jgi:thioredoxin-like negative regulator of GroEL
MTQQCFRLTLVCSGLITLGSGWGHGQEVPWRHDYSAARREAQEKGQPLLLDFGTENCFWCKRLDASTFRDPTVVQLLAGQFIPVKIDADRQPQLALPLGIRSYPTLILASPDGRVLARQEGYVEASRLADQLQRALRDHAAKETPARPVASPPAPMAPAVAAVPAPEEGSRARDQLALAYEDFLNQRYAGCLERCRSLRAIYPHCPEAAEAGKLAARIHADAELRQRACQGLAQMLGELYLELAELQVKQNHPGEAAEYLELIVRVCPESVQARTAQEKLGQLRPTLAGPTDPRPRVRAQSP